MDTQIDIADDHLNPLDHIEEILSDNNWVYDRMNEQEIMVKISGKSCDYRIFFIWQQNMGTLQFCCQYDLTVNRTNMPNAAMAVMDMNTSLWMGHFEIARDTMIPSYRNACFLHGLGERSSHDSIQDMVDVALVQCERYRHVFHMLAQSHAADMAHLSLALMETQGES